MKISVIIPIYNTEQYLSECIESVLKQTFHNLEIVLVDDGSTDHSADICHQYASSDQRIIYLYKENGGLSDARNYGIDHATGDYVLFLDSDDYWKDEHAIEKLCRRIKKSHADVLNYSYVKYFEDSGKFLPYFYKITDMPLDLMDKESQLEYLTDHDLYIASACNKLIRRSLFEDYDLYFEKGIYSEDIEWCCRLLRYADSMDFICSNFYIYRQRSGSITHTIKDKNCQDLKDNILKCIRHGKKTQDSLRKYIYRYTAYQYGTFYLTQAYAVNEQTACISTLKKYRWILKYHGRNRKLIALYCCTKLMGYARTCHMVRFLYNIRR